MRFYNDLKLFKCTSMRLRGAINVEKILNNFRKVVADVVSFMENYKLKRIRFNVKVSVLSSRLRTQVSRFYLKVCGSKFKV